MTDESRLAIETEHVRALGPEMGPIYSRLWREIVQVRWEWSEYLVLFDQPKDRIDALNVAAGHFFFLVQRVLFRHVLSTIAKLTDKTQTAGQPNLTVRRLPALASARDAAFGVELAQVIGASESVWKPVAKWRHKLGAHLDLDIALDRRAEPLPPVGRAVVDVGIGALCEILQTVDRRVSPGVDVRYDIAGRYGGASSLLHWLDVAKRADDQRMDRLRTGRAIPEDVMR